MSRYREGVARFGDTRLSGPSVPQQTVHIWLWRRCVPADDSTSPVVAHLGATLPCITVRDVSVTNTRAGGGEDDAPKRFGVRDLRNDTAGVLAEAERSGAVYITRNGEVVAKLVPHREHPDTRTPTRRLLDRVAGLSASGTGWADEHAAGKLAEIEAQGDVSWP